MVFNSGASSKAQRLAQSLGIVSDTLPAIGQAIEVGYNREYGQGALSVLQGEEKPSKGLARIKGWETMKGERAAQGEYKQEVTQFYNDNHQVMAPDEFESGLAEISQKYLSGNTNNFLQGFLPKAVDIETKAFEDYVKYQDTRFNEETVGMLSQKAHDDATGLLEGVLEEHFNISLDDLQDNPQVYAEFVSGDYSYLFGPSLRASLSEAQVLGLEIGLGRQEVSRIFINQIGELAKELGIPELLAFAYERDESGIQLARKTEGIYSDDYRLSAEANQRRFAQSYLASLGDVEKEELKLAQQAIEFSVNDVLATGTKEDAQALIEELMSDKNFWLMGNASTLHKNLLAFITSPESEEWDSPHAEVTNPYVLAMFDDARFDGTLDKEALEAVAHLLTDKDYRELLGIWYEQEGERTRQQAILDAELDKTEAKLLEESLDQFHKNTFERVSNIKLEGNALEQQAQALALRAELLGDTRFFQLEDTKYRSILDDLTDLAMVDVEFDTKGNEWLYTELLRRIEQDDITWEEIVDIQLNREYQGEPLENVLSRNHFVSLEKAETSFRKEQEKSLQTLVEKFEKEAKEAKEKREKALEETAKEQKKIAKNNAQLRFVFDIQKAQGLSPSERLSFLNSLQTRLEEEAFTHEYSDTEVLRYQDLIQTELDRTIHFPSQDHQETFTNLRYKASNGSLTRTDINIALSNHEITRDSFNKLIEALEQNEAQDVSWEDKDDILNMEKILIRRASGRTDEYTSTPEIMNIETALEMSLLAWHRKFLEDNGRRPNWDEYMEGTLHKIYGEYRPVSELLNPEVSTDQPLVKQDGATIPVSDYKIPEPQEAKSGFLGFGKKEEVKAPFANFQEANDAFYEMTQAGTPISVIRESLLEDGVSNELVTAYMRNYSLEYTMNELYFKGDILENVQEIEQRIIEAGFSGKQVSAIVNEARQILIDRGLIH